MTRRTGRRPGKTETRDVILRIAQSRFRDAGYGAVSLRAIAREADVDPSLITHFFGSKAGLFVAAFELPLDPAEVVARTLAGPAARAGRCVIEIFLECWREEAGRNQILMLLDQATSDPQAASLLHEFLIEDMLMPLVDALGGDMPRVRAGLVSAQLTGIGLSRYRYGLVSPSEVDDERLIDAVAPTLQRYLTGSLVDEAVCR